MTQLVTSSDRRLHGATRREYGAAVIHDVTQLLLRDYQSSTSSRHRLSAARLAVNPPSYRCAFQIRLISEGHVVNIGKRVKLRSLHQTRITTIQSIDNIDSSFSLVTSQPLWQLRVLYSGVGGYLEVGYNWEGVGEARRASLRQVVLGRGSQQLQVWGAVSW